MQRELPHAFERIPAWFAAWANSGRLVLLLDFDGTLAPIVEQPELARPHPDARQALERLRARGDVDLAIVSGRGLDDARALAGIEGIAYAGNHGMEISAPGLRQVHAAAAAARPALERTARVLREAFAEVPGTIVEDKGLTLSIHFRMVEPGRTEFVRETVERFVAGHAELRTTDGKMVKEVRPRVDWDKGRAVRFLLAHLAPPPHAPVIYIGDDVTDEDAFRALAAATTTGEGVRVIDQPNTLTAATSYLRSPDEVAELLGRLAGGR